MVNTGIGEALGAVVRWQPEGGKGRERGERGKDGGPNWGPEGTQPWLKRRWGNQPISRSKEIGG